MPKPDRLAGLTEEENRLYATVVALEGSAESKGSSVACNRYSAIRTALESLAASRASEARRLALLEKHEWIWNPHFAAHGEGQGRYECRECHQEHRMPLAKPLWLAIKEDFFHKPSCALAAELRGGG